MNLNLSHRRIANLILGTLVSIIVVYWIMGGNSIATIIALAVAAILTLVVIRIFKNVI